MHSWPIMVESMSARNSLLRRSAAGCTTTSIGRRPARAQLLGERALVDAASAVKGMSAAMPAPSQFAARRRPAARRARARARRRRARFGIADQGRDMSHGDADAGQARCLSQGRPRAASRRWRWRWPRSSAASSSMPIRCRSIATCASSRRGRRRTKKRACRTGSTAMSTRRRIIRSGAGAAMSRAALDEAAGAGPRADPGRRHRALFQGADRGACGGAADPGRYPRARARAAAKRRRRRRCTPNWRARDPATAQRLMPNDRSRIARALEVVLATGRSLSRLAPRGHAAAARCRPAPPRSSSTCERAELVRRIEARFAAMLAGRRAGGGAGAGRAQARSAAAGDEGARRALADPASRAARSRSTRRPPARIMDTRRYAKRQVTWFRNQMPDWPWAAADSAKALESQLRR